MEETSFELFYLTGKKWDNKSIFKNKLGPFLIKETNQEALGHVITSSISVSVNMVKRCQVWSIQYKRSQVLASMKHFAKQVSSLWCSL